MASNLTPKTAPADPFSSDAFSAVAESVQPFTLRRREGEFSGRLVCVDAEEFSRLRGRAAEILHPKELAYYLPLPAERRRVSYLLGRYAAKRALGAGLPNVPFARIRIATGVFKDPVVCHPMPEPWQVGISHSEAGVCAIAFPAVHPLALDLETIDPERAPAMLTQCLEAERAEAIGLGLDLPTAATLLWTAKEALSKALRTGLTCPFEVFEARSLNRLASAEFQGLYKNFAQYQFRAWTSAKSMLALTLPKRTEIVFENGSPRLPRAGTGFGPPLNPPEGNRA